MSMKNTAADAADATGTAETTDTATDTREGGTAAEDAFETELESVIAEGLSDDEEDLDHEDDDEEEGDFDDAEGGDDLDDDDDEEAGEPAARAGEQPRDEQGKFTTADAAAGAAKGADGATKSADGATNGAAAATTETGGDATTAAAAAAPKWDALTVKVDKEAVPIEEARISRVNGHVFVAMPEAQYDRFAARLSRGVVAERKWRELDQGIRELEARKNAPAPKSDAEIEAELVLALVKPHLADLLDEKDVALLEARIDNAKFKAKQAFDKAEAERLSKAAETPWEQQQEDGLQQTVDQLVRTYPDLQRLSKSELDEIVQREFLPVRNALVFREDGQVYANTQWMYDRLKARADAKPAPTASGASAPSQSPGSSAANTGHAATTATANGTPVAKTPADAAERFNRGVDAAKPRTTSVKAGRDDRPRQRNTRDSDRPHRRKHRSPRDEHVAAEDTWRKTERAFLNAPGLDFDPGDEE